MYQPTPPPSPRETLPTMYDLPSEDPKESGLPDEFHCFQPQLLRETCQPAAVPQSGLFIGTDLNLYYDGRHTGWYKRPDWFLVLGVERAQRQEDLRWSYVIWQETIAPFLVIELLSPGTEAEDLGQTLREVNQPPTKWQVYEQILRVPYYGLFDRLQNQFRLFQLVGDRYQAVPLPKQRFWFEPLQLGLGIWSGAYQDTDGSWLRWYNLQEEWIPTATEQVDQEQARLKQAAINLIASGMAATQVADLLGFSLTEIESLQGDDRPDDLA